MIEFSVISDCKASKKNSYNINMIKFVDYSLFHQILGVTLLNLLDRCLKFFNKIFLGSFFIFTQHPWKFATLMFAQRLK